jgi:ferredoxin--NADP+ reductase
MLQREEQMHKIEHSEQLAQNIQRITVQAPKIARKRKPGQFIILRIDEHGERIPLTIFDADEQAGTISLVVQGLGKTTMQLNNMKAGEDILDIVGPLGVPSHIENFGNVVVMGGGVGTAVAYPTAKALKAAGNHVTSIIGCRTHELIIVEEDMAEISDESYVSTDDGSYGFKGLCTEKLQELIDAGKQIDMVFAVGPLPMMRAVAEVTRPYQIPTVASLNPIMIDGTGMCGGCRATVGGKNVFVCVDGPEFDAHQIDFEQLIKRNRSYFMDEKMAVKAHECNLEKALIHA